MSKYIILDNDGQEYNKIKCSPNNPNDWHGRYYPEGYKNPDTEEILTNDSSGGYQEYNYGPFDILKVYRSVGETHTFHINGQTFKAKNISHFSGK